jgi:hypothetical protein
MHTHEPCTREHLRAICPRDTYWGVDDDGKVVALLEDYEEDTADLEQYVCFNCHQYWMPEDPGSNRDWGRAWQAALDHLKTEGVAA